MSDTTNTSDFKCQKWINDKQGKITVGIYAGYLLRAFSGKKRVATVSRFLFN
jgi:hypothetical protein